MRVMNFQATRWITLLAACVTVAGATVAIAPAVMAQNTTAPVDAWLTYKGDAQRTNSRAVTLGMPLNLLWRHSTDSPPGEFITSPLVNGPVNARKIFFSTGDALYCVDAGTGAQIWRSAMTAGTMASPLSMIRSGDTDLIIGVTANDIVLAVRASNGTLAWQYTARSQVRAGAPAVIQTTRGQRIVVAIGDSRLVALTPQGEVDADWSVRLGRRIADPSSTPALSLDGKRLFITARDRNVYALDTETGATAFTIELESSSQLTPVIAQNEIILIARNLMSGHSTQDGKRLWSLDLRDTVLASPAAMTSGTRSTIYVGTRNGTLSAIEASTGKVLWSINVEASITTTPTVLTNLILVGTGNGLLIGIKPEDGSVVWQYRLHTARTVPAENTTLDDGAFITGAAQFGPGIGTPTPGVPVPGTTVPGATFPGTAVPGVPVPGNALPAVPVAPPDITQIFGISATPVVVGGKLFVLGDNAAFYAFDATVLDVLPPRPVAPSLSVPDTLNQLVPSLLENNKTRAIPGQAPIYFAAELSDTGSGINPTSIQVTLNKKPVPLEHIYFQRSSGVLTVTLAEKVPLNKGNLTDGQYTVAVTARDYHNNEMSYSTSFLVDNSLPLPVGVPPQPAQPVPPQPALPATPAPVISGNFGGGM